MNWPFSFDFGAGTARLGELKSTFNVGIIKFQNGTAVSSKMELGSKMALSKFPKGAD